MRTKWIIGLFLLTAFSCRKEELLIDREDTLSTDTALFFYQAQYNSHTATALNLTLDVIQMNGKYSEANYNNAGFSDPGLSSNTLNFATASPYIHGNNTSYSTILVFDYSETQSYEEEFVGFYLRRFFEIADSLPNRNVALSSFNSEDNTPTRLHVENTGDIFGNSWQYNINQFYQLTTHDDYTSNSTSGLYLKGRLIGLMDSLLAAPQTNGDLSITLIGGNSGYSFNNYQDLYDILDHALTNNIKINVITPSGSSDMNQLALETGGFFSAFIGDEMGNPLPDDQTFSNTQIALQNLDDLLMKNVTTHRVDVTVTTTGTWSTGDNAYLQFVYDNHLMDVLIRIP